MDKLLTPPEVSELTGISVGGLAQLRYEGRGPRYRQLSPRKIRYTESDLQEWIDESARTKTGQRPAPAAVRV